MVKARSSEALAEDRWFLGLYEFVAICLGEHTRQRMHRWQAAWTLWQVCVCIVGEGVCVSTPELSLLYILLPGSKCLPTVRPKHLISVISCFY